MMPGWYYPERNTYHHEADPICWDGRDELCPDCGCVDCRDAGGCEGGQPGSEQSIYDGQELLFDDYPQDGVPF